MSENPNDYGTRTLPHDDTAEQSVLGGMMLSKDAIADVVEEVTGADFYKPAHETIYEAIITLYGHGEPADAVTVADELNKRGELNRVGGAAYLHSLISSVPTAANTGFYAEIVAEQAVLRRLVEAGTKIAQLGYQADGEVEGLVNQAQAEVYSVADGRQSEDYVPLKDALDTTLDEIEANGSRAGGIHGVPTGFIEFDELTAGLQPGQMIVIAARPAMGKSTFSLDIARSAAIKHNMTTVFFSLEMGRNEIAMKILSAEASLNLSDLRKGNLDDDQWAKLATAVGKMEAAPLFIDDSPNMTLMEIRAKARRLKQRNNLKLIVLDYLQLMSSGKKVESRQQEVSEFSRALKLMAKELEVPVIALSQLNRGSEQRTDKKPMVSDLRESGCLTADTRILRSDTGAETTMGELFASGAKDVPVWSLGDDMRYVERHLTHVFSTGTKPVYRLKLASGKQIRATANHPFFTFRGWKGLGELEVGTRIGTPRHVNGPSQRVHWSDEEVLDAAHSAMAEGVTPPVFGLSKEHIRLFLKAVFETHADYKEETITLAAHQFVADALGLLLLRFGISVVTTDGFLKICSADDLVRFYHEFGVIVPVHEVARLSKTEEADPRVWNTVGNVLEEPIHVADALRSPDAHSSAPVLAKVAQVLDSAELDMLAVNDLFWDTVVSIDYEGEEEVFDATVLGNHNFIANGITVHNSIEQDADMVVLLHRDDVYDKESPRAGEADVIVAKHRNGPTKTIAVAFQGHYSRFANMTHDSYGGGDGF
ncbi:replicative DNA helicase [Rothia sp. LK2588]|uniref:replicative DNA helicase n=1 Tax=Rothia sp. LK2588 TaxID=3114369 RepID=UPI0034CDC1E9